RRSEALRSAHRELRARLVARSRPHPRGASWRAGGARLPAAEKLSRALRKPLELPLQKKVEWRECPGVCEVRPIVFALVHPRDVSQHNTPEFRSGGWLSLAPRAPSQA